MHGPSPQIERQRAIAKAYLDGSDSMAVVGKRFGVTRQRVDQILDRLDVTGELREGRRVRIAAEAKQAQIEQAKKDLAEAPPCVICKKPNLRGKWKTCSPPCAEVWRVASYQLSEERRERHRVNLAKTILKHPEKRPPSSKVWAEKILSDNPPPRNREYIVKDANSTKVLIAAGLVPPVEVEGKP